MSLLQDIIGEATAKSGDVPRMLRLCLVLAKRLQHQPLEEWVRYELEGYPVDVGLPAYRRFRCRNRGVFENNGKRMTLDIAMSVLPEALHPYYQKADVHDGVGELVDLLARTTANGDGALQIHWPVELAVHYGSEMTENAQCVKAWKEISAAALAGMIDQVKTRVLDFALEIEAVAPTAGDIAGTDPSVKEEKMTQIFNTTIAGPVQNIANGNTNVTQHARFDVAPGDLDGLLRALRGANMGNDDIDRLKEAIEQDQAEPATDSMGAKVKEWLGDVTVRAATGAAGIGLDKLGAVVVPAIKHYLGMDS